MRFNAIGLARAAVALAAATFVLGCQESPPKLVLRSLQASSALTAVCVSGDGTGTLLEECPDFENAEAKLIALVTQTMTDEVAVVSLAEGASATLAAGEVLDLDPAMPGYTFARLPGRPGEIVTSPGGASSFVGITSPGREGIVALPTTCMRPPLPDETQRDVTSFPGCTLPVAPGDIAVLVDPPASDGTVAVSCDRALGVQDGTPAGATRSECAADLTTEPGPVGRRKLAVALPELGQIAIIDAQSLVDRDPGTYGPCVVEDWVALEADLPVTPVEQQLPSDLQVNTATCELSFPPAAPAPVNAAPVVGGFALSDDGRLFVGDRALPLVHVLDTSSPCEISELPPLLPKSIETPERTVLTSRLAVSPLTPRQQRFLYAIDEFDQPGSSVMIFDVSPGSTERTPIVRPGAPRLPLEPADRVGFASAAVDVGFAFRDLPRSDPATGVATTGTLCDPNPEIASSSPAAQYRPNSDFTSGARPALLRGVFGFVLLSSGQVAVIDVDDFDAPCRRPVSTNSTDSPDFRGCVDDPAGLPPFLTVDGNLGSTPTVTNEVSCSVVQAHRVRAGTLSINDSQVGVRAPSLRAFPQFGTSDATTQTTPVTRPKLVAVDFDPLESEDGPIPQPAQVYVGSDLYGPEPFTNVLDQNPLTAQQNSIALPLVEPRGYPAEETLSLTFEGQLTGLFPSGFFELSAGAGDLADESANFCDRGVYSVELMRDLASEQFGLTGETIEQFARQYADYVQITGEYLDPDDPYWNTPRGAVCGGYNACIELFGEADARELSALRDLRILEAYQGRLVVEPREYADAEQKAFIETAIDCCFPSGTPYTIRSSQHWILTGSVSGFRHDVIAQKNAEGEFECVRDCNPRKRYYQSRVFEISRTLGTACGLDVPEAECPVGLQFDPTPEDGAPPSSKHCRAPIAGGCEDFVCTYDASAGPVQPGQPASNCILDSLNARLAVYRGLGPSERGMAFSWQTTGGFVPLAMSLLGQTASVLPQSMLYLPEYQHLAVVDSNSLGLALLSLDSLRVEASYF